MIFKGKQKLFMYLLCTLVFLFEEKCPNVTQLLHHRREKVLYCNNKPRVQVVVVRTKLKVFTEHMFHLTMII